MNQSTWYKSRLLLLKFCTFASAVTLFYIFTKPEKDSLANFSLLGQWESIKPVKLELRNEPIERKKYQTRGEQNLNIETLIFPNFGGNSPRVIELHIKPDLKPEDLTIVEDKKVGSYALFNHNNSSYLTACVHSTGKTAFNSQQLGQLANYNIGSRIVPWILGLSDIRDWRCLWVNMSIDLKDISQAEANRLLQNKLYSILPKNKLE